MKQVFVPVFPPSRCSPGAATTLVSSDTWSLPALSLASQRFGTSSSSTSSLEVDLFCFSKQRPSCRPPAVRRNSGLGCERRREAHPPACGRRLHPAHHLLQRAAGEGGPRGGGSAGRRGRGGGESSGGPHPAACPAAFLHERKNEELGESVLLSYCPVLIIVWTINNFNCVKSELLFSGRSLA